MKTEQEKETLAVKILGYVFFLASLILIYKVVTLISESEDAAFTALFFAIVAFFASMFSFMLAKLNR